jgi:hypothetical protein
VAEALGPSWASRADATDWPTPCGRARWPDPKHEIWRPDHAGPVALVCYQSPSVFVEQSADEIWAERTCF